MKISIIEDGTTYTVEDDNEYPTWMEALERFTDLLRALQYQLPEDLDEYIRRKTEHPAVDAFAEK